MFVNKLTFHIDRCRLLVFISFSPLYIPISAFHFHNIFTKSHYSWSSLVTWVFVIITIHSIFARRKKKQKNNKGKTTVNQPKVSITLHSLSVSFSFTLSLANTIAYNEEMAKIKQKRPSTKMKPNETKQNKK